MAEKPPATPATAAKAGKPLGLIIFFVVASLNVVAGFAGLFLVYKATLGFQYSAQTEDDVKREISSDPQANQTDLPVLFTMEPFTVNLGGAPQRVIRLQMSLEMLDQDGFEEIMNSGARSRDAIVRLLNDKTFNDVESLQGKLFLKDQIALALNGALKRGVVKDVYFTDFVVQ